MSLFNYLVYQIINLKLLLYKVIKDINITNVNENIKDDNITNFETTSL